ncbi:MAG: class I SAM-dependent methyltransferase [Lamprocystis purpurea]|uniref:class I SAM-dependent methyltransferase n=1 Tax=Lamprocystis purpurea TaxID=61598 RepID=UPI000A07BC80|nr:class I SAM-dependent methyltransferase [Lamprocystis purpurea]MBV5273799.1 class I SAM-dependent methyltransferase [Lamprocystis purpurea]
MDESTRSTLPMSLPKLEPLDARMPPWTAKHLQERHCPLCEATNAPALLRPDGLPLAYCSACALWYLVATPSEKALGEYYREGYWISTRPSSLNQDRANEMRQNAARFAPQDIRLQRLNVIARSLVGKRLLDVGCGLGYFMLQAQSLGAHVAGQDPAPEAVRFAQTCLHLNVCEDMLENCQDHLGSFDVVVMSDVIEHPLRPLNLLHRSLNMLKPGGLLLLWTPNGGAAGADPAVARDWVGFRVDLEHMQYFSPAAIIRLSNQCNLAVEHLETLGFPDFAGIEQRPASSRRGRQGILTWRRRLAVSVMQIRTIANLRTTAGNLYQALAMAALSSEKRATLDVRSGDYHLFSIMRKKT